MLNNKGDMKFNGNLLADELKQVLEKSDILVHVESFETSDISNVRHSISTKIADYLSSSRLILAVGPDELASIKYLKDNNAAIVIDTLEKIEEKLTDVLVCKNLKEEAIIDNARKLSLKNHLMEENSNKLLRILDKAIVNI